MNNSSRTSGGQVPVRQTTEGIRDGGGNNGRGCVSPLGGVSNSTPGDQSRVQERSERPQGPVPKPEG
jgi:hypothetical protein